MKKYAIVTGVASGIGECVAQNLSKDGIIVFGIDKKIPKNLETLQNITFLQCNIEKENEVVDAINKIKETTDKVQILINVAGIFCDKCRTRVEDLELEEWNNVINVNLTGTFLVSKYAIPLLKNAESGCIVNFSTEQVVMPQIKSAPYAVSKAGIEMLSKIMAVELLQNKVRVNTIALASVRTNFILDYKKDPKIVQELMENTNKSMPLGIIEPYDVFKLVKFLIDDSKITGQTLIMDGGVVIDKNIKR